MKTIDLDQTDEETRRKIEKAEVAIAWTWVALGLAVFWAALAVIVMKLTGQETQAANTIGLVVFAVVWLAILLVGGMCCSVPKDGDHVVD